MSQSVYRCLSRCKYTLETSFLSPLKILFERERERREIGHPWFTAMVPTRAKPGSCQTKSQAFNPCHPPCVAGTQLCEISRGVSWQEAGSRVGSRAGTGMPHRVGVWVTQAGSSLQTQMLPSPLCILLFRCQQSHSYSRCSQSWGRSVGHRRDPLGTALPTVMDK